MNFFLLFLLVIRKSLLSFSRHLLSCQTVKEIEEINQQICYVCKYILHKLKIHVSRMFFLKNTQKKKKTKLE